MTSADFTQYSFFSAMDWTETIDTLMEFDESVEHFADRSYDTFVDYTELLKESLFGYFKVGCYAKKIRDLKLWERGKFADFRSYCKAMLGRSYWWVARNIEAYQICKILISAGYEILPQCEAQARPLARFLKEPNGGLAVAEAWQTVLDNLVVSGITAQKIEGLLGGGTSGKKSRISLNSATLDRIRARALDEGLSVEEYLDSLFGDTEPESEPEPEPAKITEFAPEDEERLDYLDRSWNNTSTATKEVSSKKLICLIARTDTGEFTAFDKIFQTFVDAIDYAQSWTIMLRHRSLLE